MSDKIANPSCTWLWTDELRVLRRLRPECRPRYIASTLRRARDFEGQPVTLEFEAKFLELAAKAGAAVIGSRTYANPSRAEVSA